VKLEDVAELEKEFQARFPNEPTLDYQSLTDRIRRSLSWMRKAIGSEEVAPVRFVDLWIALNALYGQRRYDAARDDSRTEFNDFS
jgi:3-deoxy-D-arabino-heptulosonate 7-phosphate (DAHP) synthase class II